ncbi:surfeit locus protein 1 isoform X2 [Bacillus rossius redtenbacheri]|uniref:surfeit locus protein 1 isoform X2 n=1 Tax=Bacillus rossius redtenbacheri TaxID=93214 RepID=UPI002FDD611E
MTMNKCAVLLLKFTNYKKFQLPGLKNKFSSCAVRHGSNPIARHKFKSPDKSMKYDPFGIALLSVPVAAFALGTWQVKRRQWKLQLIADLSERFNTEPEELPYDLSLLDDMEYRPVRVRGQFDHSKELYMGPRSLIVDGDSPAGGGVFSGSSGGQTGYLVITPFQLADRDLTILVNRGWVPARLKSPELRMAGQVQGEVELVGVIRCSEGRPPFLPKNRPDCWVYRDLAEMANTTGATPVFLDAAASSTVPGGPIGGQTRVTLRNEHMSYIITWYTLAAVTAFMWHKRFIRGLPVV